jgi:hypothetical protein
MKIPNNEKNVFNCGERDLFTHLATKLTIHHPEKKEGDIISLKVMENWPAQTSINHHRYKY